jgi:tRNA 2-thiouridine synthesizing protein A
MAARSTTGNSDFNQPACHAALAALEGGMDEPLLIDARGHHCPVPTLKLQKVLMGLAAGARVRLLADDPMAKVDVPHFCTEAGHILISAEPLEAGMAFIVERRA